MTKGFKLNLKGEQLWIEKENPGEGERPILGWVDNNRITYWLNHLRGVKNTVVNVYERPEMNENHITLYHNDEIIGWVEKDRREEILQSLWDYRKDEWQRVKTEKREPRRGAEDYKQLALF